MPSRFRSGEMTNKYDHVVPVEVVDKMQSYQSDADKLRKDFDGFVNDCNIFYEDEFKVLRNDQQALTRTHQLFEHRVNQDHDLQLQYVHMLNRFYNSPLIRFLNFFGCWFIYGTNGSVYENIPKNEEYGRAPLLTRIKRGIKDLISSKSIDGSDDEPGPIDEKYLTDSDQDDSQ